MGKNNIPLSTLSSIKKRRVYRKLDPRIVLSIHEKSLTVYHLKKDKNHISTSTSQQIYSNICGIKISSDINDNIKHKVRKKFKNPNGPIFFQNDIILILNQNGIYLKISKMRKLSNHYFNEWCKEYEQTILAGEQRYLIEISKKKF